MKVLMARLVAVVFFILFYVCMWSGFFSPQGKGIVIETEESKKIKRREEDLNGVNPFYAILGAGGAAAMSFGSWKVRACVRWACSPASADDGAIPPAQCIRHPFLQERSSSPFLVLRHVSRALS